MDPGILLDLVVGALAGVVSGLLGVGGGIVLTPVLHYGLGMSWADAVALSLFVIAIQSPIGVWKHREKGAVDFRLAVPLTLGGALGVAIGHLALPHVPVATLKLVFAALLGLGAWRMRHPSRPHDGQVSVPKILGAGVLAGIVSRLLGVGGGIVTVPLLGLMGVAVHVAVGTSLVPVFTNAAVASGANLAIGLDWQRGVFLALGAMAGSVGGVRLAHALPETGLRRVVAVAMAAAAASIVLEVFL